MGMGILNDVTAIFQLETTFIDKNLVTLYSVGAKSFVVTPSENAGKYFRLQIIYLKLYPLPLTDG